MVYINQKKTNIFGFILKESKLRPKGYAWIPRAFVLSLQSFLTLSTPWTGAVQAPLEPPGKSTGVGCHGLLQGIFSIQGSNPGLLHCRWILYPPSHLGSPWVAYTFSNLGKYMKHHHPHILFHTDFHAALVFYYRNCWKSKLWHCQKGYSTV